MTMTFSGIVRLDPDQAVDGQRVRRQGLGLLTNELSRRQFGKVFGVAGMGLGLTVLGWLPPMTRKACACHTTYTVWDDCAGIDYGGCNGCCNVCGSDVGSGYCCNDSGATGYKWHRHDAVNNVDYAIRLSSCIDRNAWKWTIGSCCNGRRNRRYRCSDGKYRYCSSQGCTGWYNSVCPRQINSGNAC